jgi:hypothetical protein
MAKKKTTTNNLPEGAIPFQAAYITSPEFRHLYVNFVQASFTPFDVSLMMGEVMGFDDKGQQVINQKARVVMSAAEAKVLMYVLANTVRQWETAFGKITMPPGQVPPNATKLPD